MFKLKILREIILDHPGGPKMITRVLMREMQESQSQRLEDVTLQALKMEEVATSQGVQATSPAGKGRGMDSFLEPPEGMRPY